MEMKGSLQTYTFEVTDKNRSDVCRTCPEAGNTDAWHRACYIVSKTPESHRDSDKLKCILEQSYDKALISRTTAVNTMIKLFTKPTGLLPNLQAFQAAF